MATTVVMYLILTSGHWRFLGVDPRPVTWGYCESVRDSVDRVYTGTDGNMKIVCSEEGRDA